MKKLVIIDGNAIVHRAFHALPPLKSPTGMITNAVFGFSAILLKMIKDLKPDYIVATFDLAGPTIRHEEFEEYKAHRQKAPQELYDQIPLVKDIVSAFGIPIYEKQGYEADDMIGTIVTLAKQEPDLQIVIATGDLDTLQLVEGKKVQIFTLKKGVNDTILYDETAIMERYGLRPDQLVDYRGLKGDPSDNIPGVKGIGEKTASSLIQEFGTLENLYTELAKEDSTHKLSPKLKEKLIADKEMAFLSKQLSTIYCDLEVDFAIGMADWQRHMSREKIEKQFRDLGFATLVRRLDDVTNVAPPQTAMDLFSSTPADANAPASEDAPARAEPAPTEPAREHARDLHSQSNQVQLAKSITKSGKIALATGLGESGELTGLVVATDDAVAYSIDFADSAQAIPNSLKDILEDQSIAKLGHDLKATYKLLSARGIRLWGLSFDTRIAAYLLQPELRAYDFERLYYNEFQKTPDLAVNAMPGQIFELAARLESRLQESGLDKIFHTMEMPLIEILAEMELAGIKIDIEAIKQLLGRTNTELASLEKSIYEQAGEEFNINSPAQLGVILFEKLAIKGRVKKTGGGARSTAAPELEKIRGEHPIIDLVLRYRELQKLKTTYIEPFPTLVDAHDRVHTTYNQAGTATGRLASQDPNLQNIPTRTELGQEFRKAFIAEPGYKLVACDYSQLELRLAAHMAGDETMISAFRSGEDIHTRTAAQIFGVATSEVTKDMRRQAKTLNFGVLYGMGPVAFSQQAGVTMAEAKEFIRKYFEEFSGITRYIEATKKSARELGYTETLFGRKRSAADVLSTMPMVRAQAERMAVNHPIQGTEADLIKIAMIHIHEYLENNHTSQEARMLLQVHDELVFEIKADLVDKLTPHLKEIMESAHAFEVPIVVDVKKGDNWAEMRKT